MDALITILIFIVAAVLSAVFKKKQAQEEEAEDDWSTPAAPQDRGGSTRTPARPSWEEELRRLLEGTETPAAPPPPPPPPRPARPLPPPPPPIPREVVRPLTASPSRLRTSEAACNRARHIESKAQDQLRRAADRVRLHTPTARKTPKTSDVKTARRMLDSPATLRSAIIVSVLLGKPRSLDPYQ